MGVVLISSLVAFINEMDESVFCLTFISMASSCVSHNSCRIWESICSNYFITFFFKV